MPGRRDNWAAPQVAGTVLRRQVSLCSIMPNFMVKTYTLVPSKNSRKSNAVANRYFNSPKTATYSVIWLQLIRWQCPRCSPDVYGANHSSVNGLHGGPAVSLLNCPGVCPGIF